MALRGQQRQARRPGDAASARTYYERAKKIGQHGDSGLELEAAKSRFEPSNVSSTPVAGVAVAAMRRRPGPLPLLRVVCVRRRPAYPEPFERA
jgi:hypothetical protein